MKQLITRPNEYGIGIDIGWRLESGTEIWWGNTKDKTSLKLVIEDMRRNGYEFTVAEPID